jgi:hypothetical protein
LSTGSNKIGVPKEHVAAINTLIDAEEYFNNRYVVSKIAFMLVLIILHRLLSFLIDHRPMFKSCQKLKTAYIMFIGDAKIIIIIIIKFEFRTYAPT